MYIVQEYFKNEKKIISNRELPNTLGLYSICEVNCSRHCKHLSSNNRSNKGFKNRTWSRLWSFLKTTSFLSLHSSIDLKKFDFRITRKRKNEWKKMKIKILKKKERKQKQHFIKGSSLPSFAELEPQWDVDLLSASTLWNNRYSHSTSSYQCYIIDGTAIQTLWW